MRRALWVKVAWLVFLVIGVGLILKAIGVDLTRLSPERVRAFVVSFGGLAPLVYLAAYGQPVVPLPASVMTITGGLAFGPAWGTAAALAGATLRACTQFGVARLLGRDAVAKLLKGGVASLDQKIGEQGFKTVLLIRLIPNLPFDVQNYGLGFSRVRFASYAIATFLGMIPGCFAFVYFGYSLTDPKQIWKLGLAVALVAGLIFAQRAWKSRSQRPA
jgi:uncharacterized membrane protein YdjX (TVP38/TMEM64 family)